MAEPLTVLVDEYCVICTRAGRWLARRDGIVVEAIGSAAGAQLLRDLTPGERYASVHAVDAVGRRLPAAPRCRSCGVPRRARPAALAAGCGHHRGGLPARCPAPPGLAACGSDAATARG
jgi:hypothetical protein